MSPNCERCDRGEHHLCDNQWCECRESHGVEYDVIKTDVIKTDTTPLQYRLVLDDLNRLTATFMHLSDTNNTTVLSIPRDVWDHMGHPTSLTVNATP